MVFGDNVRARRAARALPRTPREKEKEEEDKRRNHTPPSPPFHNHTPLPQTRPPLNQQCCDSKHKGGSGKEETEDDTVPLHQTPPHFPTHNTQHKGKQDNARGSETAQGAGPTEDGAPQQHMPPHHSTGPPHEQEGRTRTPSGEANDTATPQRYATPPLNDSHPLHHCEGGADRGYPTTRTPQTHTHHPHTTASGKEQYATRLQYSHSTHWE